MAKHQRGEPKVSYGIRVQKHVYEEVARVAIEKKWSESQTTDELLAWTITQLKIAGSFDALMQSSLAPHQQSAKQGIERLRKAEAHLTRDEKKKVG